MPRRLRCDLIAAYKAEKRRREDPRRIGAVVEITSQSHQRSVREAYGAFTRLGYEWASDFGIEDLTDPLLIVEVLDQLKAENGSIRTISRIGYGVAAALQEVCGEEHPHWEALQDVLKRAGVYPDHAAPEYSQQHLELLLAHSGFGRLKAAICDIVKTALKPGLGRKDRAARLAYAFLLSLKLAHPALTEKSAARLHLRQDITLRDGRPRLRLVLAGKPVAVIWQEMEPLSCILWRLVLSYREMVGLSTGLLFPTRDDLFRGDSRSNVTLDKSKMTHRGTAPVMLALSSDIEFVTGIKVTFSDLKDLVVRVWLEDGLDELIVAKRAGYKFTRSMLLRHAPFFKSNQAKAAA